MCDVLLIKSDLIFRLYMNNQIHNCHTVAILSSNVFTHRHPVARQFRIRHSRSRAVEAAAQKRVLHLSANGSRRPIPALLGQFALLIFAHGQTRDCNRELDNEQHRQDQHVLWSKADDIEISLLFQFDDSDDSRPAHVQRTASLGGGAPLRSGREWISESKWCRRPGYRRR